jgi:hypothetical protein
MSGRAISGKVSGKTKAKLDQGLRESHSGGAGLRPNLRVKRSDFDKLLRAFDFVIDTSDVESAYNTIYISYGKEMSESRNKIY